MSVVEIPLDSEETKEINSENNNIIEEIEQNDAAEIEENQNIPENIENEEDIPEKIEEIPQKKPRGRPKGSVKPKKERAAPVKPPKQRKEATQKKAPRKVYYEESESGDELPDYVRQEVLPPHPQQDIATQMLKLLQNHENIRTARRQQLYSSWFRHY